MTDEILKSIDKEMVRQLEIVKAFGIDGIDTIKWLEAFRVAVNALDAVANAEDVWEEHSKYLDAKKEIAAILGVEEGE